MKPQAIINVQKIDGVSKIQCENYFSGRWFTIEELTELQNELYLKIENKKDHNKENEINLYYVSECMRLDLLYYSK